jgi:hypothetical protein
MVDDTAVDRPIVRMEFLNGQSPEMIIHRDGQLIHNEGIDLGPNKFPMVSKGCPQIRNCHERNSGPGAGVRPIARICNE